jgi:hypothetical protein
MDLFDEKLKTDARQETVAVPDGFDERIDQKLAGLAAGKNKKSPAFKVLLIAAAFLALSAVTVLASPAVQRMAQGIIAYFSSGQDSAYASQKEELQKYSSVVDVAVQDQGITLKIDNIAVDDGYINVFYTVQGSAPIKILGREVDPMAWRLEWTAPTLFFKADGQELTLPALIEQEAYLENVTTLKGMERFAVVESLPDNFRLEIFTNYILNVKGNWQLALDIDKSAVRADTRVVTPGIKASVTSGWDQPFAHTVTVDKVLISPFGSQLVLTEMVNDCKVFADGDFTLRDDQGRFLDIVSSQRSAGREKETVTVTNSFEFLNGNPEMKDLTLIPLSYRLRQEAGSFAPVMATAPLSPAPFRLQQSELGTIVVDKIDLSAQGLKITYHADGILEFAYFFLLDQNARELKNLKLAVDRKVDRQTGQHIDTYTFTNHPTAAEIAAIRQIGTLTYDLKLRTAEQVAIPLR